MSSQLEDELIETYLDKVFLVSMVRSGSESARQIQEAFGVSIEVSELERSESRASLEYFKGYTSELANVSQEMKQHLEARAASFIAEGVPPVVAAQFAMALFANLGVLRFPEGTGCIVGNSLKLIKKHNARNRGVNMLGFLTFSFSGGEIKFNSGIFELK